MGVGGGGGVSLGADVGLAVVVGWTLGAAVAVVTRASGLALGATEGVGAARPQAASSTQTAITIASLFIATLFYHNERQDAKMKSPACGRNPSPRESRHLRQPQAFCHCVEHAAITLPAQDETLCPVQHHQHVVDGAKFSHRL